MAVGNPPITCSLIVTFAEKLRWLHWVMHTLERSVPGAFCILQAFFDHNGVPRTSSLGGLLKEASGKGASLRGKSQTRKRLPKTAAFCNATCFTIHLPVHFGVAMILDFVR